MFIKVFQSSHVLLSYISIFLLLFNIYLKIWSNYKMPIEETVNAHQIPMYSLHITSYPAVCLVLCDSFWTVSRRRRCVHSCMKHRRSVHVLYFPAPKHVLKRQHKRCYISLWYLDETSPGRCLMGAGWLECHVVYCRL